MIRVNFCYDIMSSYDPGQQSTRFGQPFHRREFVRLSRRAIYF